MDRDRTGTGHDRDRGTVTGIVRHGQTNNDRGTATGIVRQGQRNKDRHRDRDRGTVTGIVRHEQRNNRDSDRNSQTGTEKQGQT